MTHHFEVYVQGVVRSLRRCLGIQAHYGCIKLISVLSWRIFCFNAVHADQLDGLI